MTAANHYRRDLTIVALSLVLALALVKTDIVKDLLTNSQELKVLGSFIAGLFFTSLLTAAPATVALGEIAQTNSLLTVAVMGGLGALIGDLVIFRFVKNSLADDLAQLLSRPRQQRLRAVFHRRYLRGFVIFLGALVVASPLPDELGLAMMGLSKLKTAVFIPLSFLLNGLGILIIGLIAKALL